MAVRGDMRTAICERKRNQATGGVAAAIAGIGDKDGEGIAGSRGERSCAQVKAGNVARRDDDIVAGP